MQPKPLWCVSSLIRRCICCGKTRKQTDCDGQTSYTATIEAKKMIVSCLIKRVEVYRDYKLHIDFNIDFTQFCEGLDIVTIAA